MTSSEPRIFVFNLRCPLTASIISLPLPQVLSCTLAFSQAIPSARRSESDTLNCKPVPLHFTFRSALFDTLCPLPSLAYVTVPFVPSTSLLMRMVAQLSYYSSQHI